MGTPQLPRNQVDESAIREQLERIVSSPGFTASRKYPALLRYVVEETLAGRCDQLKERSLGVVVFGRDLEYDTNQDPIVRTAAAEVRRRLALFYHSHGEEHTVEIGIPLGTYVPTFVTRTPNLFDPVKPEPPIPPIVMHERVRERKVRYQGPRRRTVYAVSAAVLLAGLPALWYFSRMPSALDRFWQPFVKASAPSVICMSAFSFDRQAGQTAGSQGTPAAAVPPAGNPAQTGSPLFARLSVSDIHAIVGITGVLREKHAPFDLRNVSGTSLRDLHQKPAVVIGAFNNSWTRQLVEGLRFSFRRDDAADTSWIFDGQKPADRQWQIVDTTANTKAPLDYAIVGRFRHPLTEQTVVVVAGLTQFGTVAAGEFVSREDRLRELDSELGKGWEKKNLEVVLETRLVRSDAGPARIVATHVW
jgi:hypothetical protein